MDKKTRGLRNNNPGNIRRSSQHFVGELTNSTDKSFKQFESMAYGYRALFKIIITYYTRYHLTTVEDIISRYSPPTENNTDVYIQYVSKRLGVQPNERMDLDDTRLFCDLIIAMTKMETGIDASEDEVIDGYNLV